MLQIKKHFKIFLVSEVILASEVISLRKPYKILGVYGGYPWWLSFAIYAPFFAGVALLNFGIKDAAVSHSCSQVVFVCRLITHMPPPSLP